jgi:hypothetical protein
VDGSRGPAGSPGKDIFFHESFHHRHLGFVGSALARRIKEADPASELFGIDNLMRSGSEMNRRLTNFEIGAFHGDTRCTSDMEGCILLCIS